MPPRSNNPSATLAVTAGVAFVVAIIALLVLRVEGNRDALEDGLERAPATPDAATDLVGIEPPDGLSEPIAAVPAEAPAQPEAELATSAPGRVFDEPVVLLVRDRTTRADLTGIELRCVPKTHMIASWRRPAARDAVSTLGVELASPLSLRSWRGDGDDSQVRRGFVLSSAGELEGGAGQDVPLAEIQYFDRGLTFFARTGEHAWGRLEVDVLAGGERELLLDSACSLELSFSNVQLDAYAARELPALVFVRRTDGDLVETLVTVPKLDAYGAAEGMVLDSLEPGSYAISVELGEQYQRRDRTVLAREVLSVVANEERQLALVLDDPPPLVERAHLAGTLAFPTFDGEDDVVLRFYDMEHFRQGRSDGEVEIGAMQRIGGAGSAWRWDAGELPVGTYQAKLWPLLVSFRVDLPPEGRDDVELAIDELAAVEVDVVAAESGERVALKELFWSRSEELEGKVNHVGQRIPPDPVTGLFRIATAAPGALTVSVYDPPAELGFGFKSEKYEVEPGHQRFTLALEPRCGIRFVFRDGDATLPRDRELLMPLAGGITEVDGKGRVTMNRLLVSSEVELSAPGLYEVSFEGVGAKRYRPIEPRQIEVRAGEVAEVVVVLTRL